MATPGNISIAEECAEYGATQDRRETRIHECSQTLATCATGHQLQMGCPEADLPQVGASESSPEGPPLCTASVSTWEHAIY